MIIAGNSHVGCFKQLNIIESQSREKIEIYWVGSLKIEHFDNGHPAGTKIRSLFENSSNAKILSIGVHDIFDICEAFIKGDYNNVFSEKQTKYAATFQELKQLGPFYWLVFPQSIYDMSFPGLTSTSLINISLEFNKTIELICNMIDIPVINPASKIIGEDNLVIKSYLQKDMIHLNISGAKTYLDEISNVTGIKLELTRGTIFFEPENQVESFCSLLIGNLQIPYDRNINKLSLETNLLTFINSLLTAKGLDLEISPNTELVESCLLDSLNLVEIYAYASNLMCIDIDFNINLRELGTVEKIALFLANNKQALLTEDIVISDFIISLSGDFNQPIEKEQIIESESRIAKLSDRLLNIFIEYLVLATSEFSCPYGIVYYWLAIIYAHRNDMNEAIKFITLSTSTDLAFPFSEARCDYYLSTWLSDKKMSSIFNTKTSGVNIMSGKSNYTELAGNWEHLAKADPMWAIISAPDKFGNKWSLEEFFSTGVTQIRHVICYLDNLPIKVARRRALDFGCGLGRLSQSLAEYFDHVDGIDISPSMVQQARDYNRHGSSVEYHLGKESELPFANDTFDFIYSVIVLQHMPQDLSANYIKEFIRVLRPGGVALFQMPSRCLTGDNDCYKSNISTALGEAVIEMNIFPKQLALKTVKSSGGTILDVCSDQMAGEHFESYTYCVTKNLDHFEDTPNNLKNSYLVSAIISTYNSDTLLRGCIEDLLNQSLYELGQLEIIIINSGSQQNEKTIAHEFIAKFPHIVYLQTERESVYGAWNRGIAIANGKYITNANTDDAHRHDALEMMANALEVNSEADLAYCNWRWTNVPNDTLDNPIYLRECCFPPYDPAIASLYCILGPHPLWRRTLFDHIGLFDASFVAVGDYDFLFRFIAAKCKAVLVPEVLSLFYVNKQGLSRNEDFSETEVRLLHEKYHANIPIDALFNINPSDSSAAVEAWIAMGVLAARFQVPWENYELSNLEYATKCFRKALVMDNCNVTAIHNLIAVLSKLKDWKGCEQLIAEYGERVAETTKVAIRERYPVGLISIAMPLPAVNPIIYPEILSTLPTRPLFPIAYGNGFYEDEHGERWLAPAATLTINVNSPSVVCLCLTCCHDPSFYDMFPFEVVVTTIDGFGQRAQFSANSTSVCLEFSITDATSTCVLSINSSASFVPAEHNSSNKDTRRLSICMTSIDVTPLKDITTIASSAATVNYGDVQLHGSCLDNEVAICTAVSKNYLAFARTFAQSVRRIHPEIRIFVLLVDHIGTNTFDPKQEPFELILLEELDNIPNPNHFFFKFTPIELNTAAKPFVYEYIFKKFGIKKLAYFDPDILIFDSLQPIWNILESHNLALTPHITEPYPDKLHPSAVTILQAGVFNLGFIGMSNTPTTQKFLRYWQDHLYNFCFMDVAKGMHVDQNWIDFAPCMFDDVYILKDPAYNAAYWNLHYTGTKIHSRNGKYFIGDSPLVFFHFSGFKLNNLEAISIHQNRYTLSSLPNIRPLFEMYRDMLLANRHDESLKWPYAYAAFDNGIKISPFLRKIYNDQMANAKSFGNPFDTSSSDNFFNFLLMPFTEEDSNSTQYITQLIAIIYGNRQDLQMLMPDIRDEHRELFFKWLNAYGKEEYGIDAALIPGTPEYVAMLQSKRKITGDPATCTSSASVRVLDYGINFTGYYKGEFGVAVAARNYIHAASAVGIPHVINNIVADGHRNDDTSISKFSNLNPYLINFFHINADQAHNVRQKKGAAHYKDHYNIAFWVWELDRFPAKWNTSFQYYDEIWTPSEFSRNAIAGSSPIPVYTMPHPIVVNNHESHPNKSQFSLPNGQFVFLFVFDYLSVFERKNPLAAISAFRQAFANSKGALLLIKTINSQHATDKSALLHEAASGCNVRFIDQHLDSASMMSLMASIDCFISLHRSEGFGLGMAQSMYLGKPVIATGYSGNMEFMTSRNSLAVDYQLVELSQDCGPYERGNVWADPNVEHAAFLMRSVFEDKALAECIAKKASFDIKNYFSPKAIGEKMKHRIDEISSKFNTAKCTN